MSLKVSMPGRGVVIAVPYLWLILFFFLPFLILLYISFGIKVPASTRFFRSGTQTRALFSCVTKTTCPFFAIMKARPGSEPFM